MSTILEILKKEYQLDDIFIETDYRFYNYVESDVEIEGLIRKHKYSVKHYALLVMWRKGNLQCAVYLEPKLKQIEQSSFFVSKKYSIQDDHEMLEDLRKHIKESLKQA